MLKGLIFTDTYVLARNLSVQQEDILYILHQYIAQSSSYIEWHIVDIADPMYADVVDPDDWFSYAKILTDFYYGLGLNEHYNCPLFIIGGVNEIPMPWITNPLAGAIVGGSEYLYADMLYCFNYEGVSGIQPSSLINQPPRFAVGRLPLSSQHTITDLNVYLKNSVTYLSSGIYVRGAAMTTTESWLTASTDMMHDIPVSILDNDYVPLNNRMIVSPLLDTEIPDMYEGYVHELDKIDFLVCNLHGSDQEGAAFFLGQDKEFLHYFTATQPSMLKYTCPLIFNTVACHGARFVGYSVDDSMLFAALRNGTMIYTGSCDTSYGGYFGQAGNSELMMKLYNIYLHKGMPAGMALIKAKQDYYRTCHNDDGDEYAMFTILEFNLFGCPILSMQPKLAADYQPILLGHRVAEKSHIPTYRPKTMTPIIQTAYNADDIHAYVQALVDGNIYHIRSIVEKEVYARLGLPAENLQQILTISQDSYEIGYQFIYCWTPQESYRPFQMYWLVNTDKQGKITKILHTK